VIPHCIVAACAACSHTSSSTCILVELDRAHPGPDGEDAEHRGMGDGRADQPADHLEPEETAGGELVQRSEQIDPQIFWRPRSPSELLLSLF